MNLLAVIPARGGSKGIPRKNIRNLCGKPLISYVIETLRTSSYPLEVVVSSDDNEILYVAEKFGAIPILRPEQLALDAVTLDSVVYHAVSFMEQTNNVRYDYIITIQPTSPLLTANTLDHAISRTIQKGYDTVLSAVNHPKLSWRQEGEHFYPNYTARVNRQYMDKYFVETGAFVISKRDVVTKNSRFGDSVSVYEVPEQESIDIDTIEDWWLVEKQLMKKTILIRVDGYKEIGMGHIYRGLQLIEALTDCDVFFVLNKRSTLGIEKIKNQFYPYIVIEDEAELPEIITAKQVDIVVNDILNTSVSYMQMLKQCGVRIVNFEDLGEGAYLADSVINDLYEPCNDSPNFFWGSDYYLIRNEFLLEKPGKFSEKVKEILVVFGGTDPANLTKKTVSTLKEIARTKEFHCTVILGMGYEDQETIQALVSGQENVFTVIQDIKNMSVYMKEADLAISSQGRTMLELASMAVPTILLAEHLRESRHEFGSLKNGFLNLGVGGELEEKTLYKTIVWLMECRQIREAMYKEMSQKDLRHGFDRVKQILLRGQL